jgi:hypothetical protein
LVLELRDTLFQLPILGSKLLVLGNDLLDVKLEGRLSRHSKGKRAVVVKNWAGLLKN